MKKRGTGISCNTHPAGLKGGGDPSQAQIRLKPDGTLDLLVGAVDIGQGSKTILRQIAADEMGVPIEAITINNFDTDTGPMCTGTFASRVTFMDGNAVIRATDDLKRKIRSWAAKALEAGADDILVADNMVSVRGRADLSRTMAQVGAMANWGGEYLVGTGAYIPGPGQSFDPETGEMTALSSLAFGACVAEVEVDTETGEVLVTKVANVNDVGKVISWEGCEGQQYGGAYMGVGRGRSEEVIHDPVTGVMLDGSLLDYKIATILDIGTVDTLLVETGMGYGPYGAVGIGEDVATVVPALIGPAVYNAIGVWVDDFPITPERVLKALGKA